MGIYTTTKCGHCGEKWEFLSSKRSNILLGPPVVKCSSCNGLNKTKHKLFRDMNNLEKGWFYLQQGFLRIIYNVFIILLGIGLSYGLLFLEDEKGKIPFNSMVDMGNYVGIIIFGGMGLSMVWFGWKNLKQSFQLNDIIENLENTYDNNGDFVWSWEFYE